MYSHNGKTSIGTFLLLRTKFFANPYISHVYDINMKLNLFIGKYRSVNGGRIIDVKNLMTVASCILLSIFIIEMFSQTSVGQGIGFEDNNNVPSNTTSNGPADGARRVVVSTIVNATIRNEYNTTNGYFVTVLPPRTDDSIYSGVITYSASEPVKVEILHAPSISNNKINSKQIEHMSVYFNNKSIPASLILPNYSDSRFSFSIPFTGKALELSYEKPFTAIYTVSAEINKLKATANNEGMLPQQVPNAYFKAGMGTMLIEVIPYLAADTLQELPFSDLSSSDLSMIIGKVPLDKAEVILNKIPAAKQQEIINGLPAERRQELEK
jgi:hypothetical protein